MPDPKPKLLLMEVWGLGDLIIATGFLRRAMEQYDVTLLAKPYASALLGRDFPGLNMVAWDPPWTVFRGKYRLWRWPWRQMIRQLVRLRRERFDVAVSVRRDPRDHLVMWLIGARRRCGFPRVGSGVLLNQRLFASPHAPHRVEDWRQIGTALGIQGADLAAPALAVPSDSDAASSPTRPEVCVHLGARIAVRRWPETYHREILMRLRKEHDFDLTVIPDPDGYGAGLADLADRFLPRLSLPELTAALGRADLLLCNDSAPAHIAGALGTPVAAYFGPTDPAAFRPWGDDHLIVIRDICPYRPCQDYCRFPEPYCLTKLTPDEVWPELRAFARRVLSPPDRQSPAPTVDLPPSVPDPRAGDASRALPHRPSLEGRAQRSGAARHTILVFAHVPPPHHGQSYVVAGLLEELRAHPDAVRVFHVDSRVSDTLEEIGRIAPGKVWRLLRYCWQAIWIRLRHGPMIFYYVPAPANHSPLVRDWLVMTLCRPFFRRRLILHWHSVGLGGWLARKKLGTFPTWLSQRALGGAELSLVCALSMAGDAAVLHPKQIRALPNGISDPCPDFEGTVLPARVACAHERRTVFRVLFLALCTREKGLYDTLDGVLEAQRRLHATGTSTLLRLTVAGQFLSPEERTAFLAAASRATAGWPADAGLPPEVECVGFASGELKDRLLRESDCFCFPTYYPNEVMPISLIEAMAYGLPVVATRWRTIPEMLPAAGSFLVDIHQPAAVASALCAAMHSRDFAGLRAHFLSHYLRQVFGQRFLSAVQECFPAVTPSAA